MKNRSTLPILVSGIILLFACQFFEPGSTPSDPGSEETNIAQAVQETLDYNRSIEATVQAMQPSDSPTPPPTATNPPTPTATTAPPATNTSVPVIPTPRQAGQPTAEPGAPTQRPASEGPYISELVCASQVDENNLPLDPGTTLKKGITKIYGTYSYSGLEPGMKFAYYWFHNGKEFVSFIDVWNGDESGNSWANAYYTSGKSLPTGNWQLVIYVEGELMQKVTCVIR